MSSEYVPNEASLNSPSAADPHGRAALLLTESLLHGLMAREILSSGAVLDIVQTAIDVQIETDIDEGQSAENSQVGGLLDRMRATLSIDLDR